MHIPKTLTEAQNYLRPYGFTVVIKRMEFGSLGEHDMMLIIHRDDAAQRSWDEFVAAVNIKHAATMLDNPIESLFAELIWQRMLDLQGQHEHICQQLESEETGQPISLVE